MVNILKATAEAGNLIAKLKAIDEYKQLMKEVCGKDKPYKEPEDLQKHHEDNLKKACDLFASIPKMGGEEFSKPYLESLKKVSSFCIKWDLK